MQNEPRRRQSPEPFPFPVVKIITANPKKTKSVPNLGRYKPDLPTCFQVYLNMKTSHMQTLQ